MPLKVLLISPRQVRSVNSFSEAQDITGRAALMPNLALPTLAALTPPEVDLTLVDETIATIDFDAEWDFVGITGYSNHAVRMFELAAEFRKRGRLVGIGGPYATLSTDFVRQHADVLFIGEAEQTWPRFLADLAAGRWSKEYRALEALDIGTSPVPDYQRLDNAAYWFGVVQTSRGCPFECEFCDAIILLGRKQRYKTPEQVVRELTNLHQHGYRHIFMADDNFTARRKAAAEILEAVGTWNRSLAEPIFMGTQLSIDTARSSELLDLCTYAGLRYVFVGIETPNKASLQVALKRQNTKADLVDDVHEFYRHGVAIHAGMIVGFDADTPDVFTAQLEYLQEAGIPIASVSILNAPDQTPLQARLRREGRYIDGVLGDKHLQSNVVPLKMTVHELQIGMLWLVNKLYDPRNFLLRLQTLAQHLPIERQPLRWCEADQRVWDRIVTVFAGMGDEFAAIPLEAERLFTSKAMGTAKLVLSTYKHLVTLLKSWGILSDEIARMPAPPFRARTQEEIDELVRLERVHASVADAPTITPSARLTLKVAGASRESR
jgi:radical SAM superfamily enzyme YgiQ (UPF0313 family)